MALNANWHTEGRRQPAVLGKDPSGKRLPGGPYTGFQAGAAALVSFLLYFTKGMWGLLVDNNPIYELGVLLIPSYFALRAAAKLDYTNISLVWQLFGGIKAAARSLYRPCMILSSTGEPLGHSRKGEWNGDCRTLSFADLQQPIVLPVPDVLDEEAGKSASPPPLIEQIFERIEPAPTPARQFVTTGRRQPKTPAQAPTPEREPVRAPLAEPTPSRQLVGATTSPSPASALENFLAAARPAGETR